MHDQPVEPGGGRSANGGVTPEEGRGRRGRGGRARGGRSGDSAPAAPEPVKPSPMALAGTKPPAEVTEHPDAEPADLNEPGQVEDTDAREITGDPVEAALMGTAPTEPSEAPVEITWAAVAPRQTESEAAAGEPAAPDAAPAPAPIVVTSTRRRRAGRPAGPPAATAEVQEPHAETPDAQADATTPAAGDDDREAAAVDSPAQDGSDGAGAEDAAAGADAALDLGDEDNGHSLVHVPVKKKGRKR
jgi:ribonuclease E